MSAIYKSPKGRTEVLTAYQAMLDGWPVENTRMTLPTRQGDTFVLAMPSQGKPPLVLLHGSAANSASWIGDVEVWARDFSVYAVDIIGEPGLSAETRPPLESDAYAEWLDDVLAGLPIERAAFVGLSLGGWVSMDYAIRRRDRVSKLVLISPGGIGRNRNILIWALPLLLLGPWGRGKMMERIGGRVMTDPAFLDSPIGKLSALIFAHFKPRTQALPVPTNEQLQTLPMPVLAVLGGADVFIDAPETKARLEANVKMLTMRYKPAGRHFLPGEAEAIAAFLWT